MKKVFKKLFALAMLSVLLVITVFVVNAEPIDEPTQEQIDAMVAVGFTDTNFAKALLKNGVTPENYAEFNGQIDASYCGIEKIDGISLLKNASLINLEGNLIRDINPLKLEGFPDNYYAGIINLVKNPTNRFLESIADLGLVANYGTRVDQHNFFAGCSFKTEIAFVTPASVRVYFDVSDKDVYRWNASYPFTPDKLLSSSTLPQANWTYDGNDPKTEKAGYGPAVLSGDCKFTVACGLEKFLYFAGYDPSVGTYSPQENSANFSYSVTATMYAPVKQKTETVVVGGIKLTKKVAKTGVEGGVPIEGAVYDLFDAKGTRIATGVTDDNGAIYFDGITPGEYTVKEVSVPDGYEVDPNPHKVTVSVADFVASSDFAGGEQKIYNVFVGNTAYLTPDWSTWDVESVDERQTLGMYVRSDSDGSVVEELKATGDIKAYIKNGGANITALEGDLSAEDLKKVTANTEETNLTVTLGGEKIPVSSYADAIDKINDAINNNKLTAADTEVLIEGTAVYNVSREFYKEVPLTDESLCVYFEPIANKKLVGLPIEGGMFTFLLCDETGEPIFEGVNLAASADEDTTVVKFFDQEGYTAVLRFCSEAAGKTFTYTIKEVVNDEDRIEGVSYDEDERTMTVEVSETGTRGLAVKITVKNGDKVESENTLYSDQMNYENGEIVDFGTVNLCTIINRFIERENPKTGVPTLLSLVKLLTVAGASILLKKRFF